MIIYKNPGTGLPALEEEQFLGKVFAQAVPKDTLILPEFFDL
jgi:hypothetical protein